MVELEWAQRNPVPWVRNVLGQDIWSKQAEIIESVRDNPRTAVSACHAIGKSFVTAATITWFLQSFPNSVVILIAPTWRQVAEVTWREIKRIHAESKCELLGAPLQTPRWDIDKEMFPKWYALGFSSSTPEKVAGFHAPHMLVVVDEASGVTPPIFEAIRGLMTSGHTRLLMLGNPTRPEGDFYKAFTSSRHMYKTFQVSAWDTPNLAPIRAQCEAAKSKAERLAILRSAPVLRNYLVSASWVADQEEEFGTDSDFYKVRVLGQFPSGGPNQLIRIGWVDDAINRWEERYESEKPEAKWWIQRHLFGGNPVAGLDVARYGDNESVLASRLDDNLAPLDIWTGIDTVELAGFVAARYDELQLTGLNVDECGLGGGPVDNLMRILPNVHGINVGLPATNAQRFANLKAEAYWGLRERFREGRIAIPRDDRLIGQLTSIRYNHRASGQAIIESKDEMVARGLASPDRAEAAMLSYLMQSVQSAPARSRGKLTNWNKAFG